MGFDGQKQNISNLHYALKCFLGKAARSKYACYTKHAMTRKEATKETNSNILYTKPNQKGVFKFVLLFPSKSAKLIPKDFKLNV